MLSRLLNELVRPLAARRPVDPYDRFSAVLRLLDVDALEPDRASVEVSAMKADGGELIVLLDDTDERACDDRSIGERCERECNGGGIVS